jgi:hypothetical protein
MRIGGVCLAIWTACSLRTAADCGPPPRLTCVAYRAAGLVFYGQVLDITIHRPANLAANEGPSAGPADVRFNVFRGFKGVQAGITTFTFYFGEDAKFTPGDHLLVYGYKKADTTEWVTSCSRTRPIQNGVLAPLDLDEIAAIESCQRGEPIPVDPESRGVNFMPTPASPR